jgi:hypothetical protein
MAGFRGVNSGAKVSLNFGTQRNRKAAKEVFERTVAETLPPQASENNCAGTEKGRAFKAKTTS